MCEALFALGWIDVATFIVFVALGTWKLVELLGRSLKWIEARL